MLTAEHGLNIYRRSVRGIILRRLCAFRSSMWLTDDHRPPKENEQPVKCSALTQPYAGMKLNTIILLFSLSHSLPTPNTYVCIRMYIIYPPVGASSFI